jgi:glycolate oxidase
VRPAGGAGQAGAGEAGAGRLAEALSRVVVGDRIVTGPGVLQAMSRDDAGWAPAGRAAAGVRARPALDPRRVFNPGKG